MKLLFASDSFKGTLSSEQTIKLLGKAAKIVFEDVEYSGVAVADGGEGTTDAVIAACSGKKVFLEASGPLMDEVLAYYGALDENKAILEMAAVSGLSLVPKEKRNPLFTTSYGTGEMIKDALNKGFNNLSIAIGGSATNDGGMGCARALGIRFMDANGKELMGRGEDLEKVADIDVSGLDFRIKSAKITVMCDVTNPLCGDDGATYTFGAQKGASREALKRLEEGMENYRDVIIRRFGVNPDEISGSGAAGGLGTALTVFLGGRIESGIETVLDLIDFDQLLSGVDLVVTGEGCTDWQSCFGKVMQGVGRRAKAKGIAAVGLSGSLGREAESIFDYGINSLMTTVDAPMSLEEAMSRAEELYYFGAVRMLRFIRTGMEIAEK